MFTKKVIRQGKWWRVRIDYFGSVHRWPQLFETEAEAKKALGGSNVS